MPKTKYKPQSAQHKKRMSRTLVRKLTKSKKPKKRDVQKLLQTCDKFIKLNNKIKKYNNLERKI